MSDAMNAGLAAPQKKPGVITAAVDLISVIISLGWTVLLMSEIQGAMVQYVISVNQ
jgi:hypothetical protein